MIIFKKAHFLGLTVAATALLVTADGFLNSAARCRPIRPRGTKPSQIQLAQNNQNPLNGFRKMLESTTASIMEYITMQPSRAAPRGFRKIAPIQFIAALGSPTATSGNGAESWGLWRIDPGPRGVLLSQYDKAIVNRKNRAPAGWTFDPNDFWIEEYGRIMEPPEFPIPPGRYWVTGGRQATAILTIGDNNQEWELLETSSSTHDGKVTLYDVTHLPCRAARYHPTNQEGGSPATARLSDFPVKPGAEMPVVQGCSKQDYAVLFVIGIEDGM